MIVWFSLIEVNGVSHRKSIKSVCVVSFSYDEMPSASIKQLLVNIIPIIPFDFVAYAFTLL